MKKKNADFVSVTIMCPELEKEVTSSSVYIDGNWCMGHGPDEYCYCDTDKWLEISCECGKDHQVRVY